MLREMTLNEIANMLDRGQRLKEPESARPTSIAKVMVAIGSHSPNPQKLIRKATRIANRLGTEWFAVYVRTSKEAPNQIPAEVHRKLTESLEIAQRMGGTVIVLKNDHIAEALTTFAKNFGVTQIVMGRTRRQVGWLRFRPSLVDQLSANLPDVDVVLS